MSITAVPSIASPPRRSARAGKRRRTRSTQSRFSTTSRVSAKCSTTGHAGSSVSHRYLELSKHLKIKKASYGATPPRASDLPACRHRSRSPRMRKGVDRQPVGEHRADRIGDLVFPPRRGLHRGSVVEDRGAKDCDPRVVPMRLRGAGRRLLDDPLDAVVGIHVYRSAATGILDPVDAQSIRPAASRGTWRAKRSSFPARQECPPRRAGTGGRRSSRGRAAAPGRYRPAPPAVGRRARLRAEPHRRSGSRFGRRDTR